MTILAGAILLVLAAIAAVELWTCNQRPLGEDEKYANEP